MPTWTSITSGPQRIAAGGAWHGGVSWISHCLISGKPIKGEDEYHYYAFCDGPDLVFNGLPMALAGGVMRS